MSRKTLVPINHVSASADPTTPTLRAGDTYQNSTSKALRTYDGSAWQEHDTLAGATTLSGAKTFTGGVVVNTTGITGNKEINLTGTGASSVGGTLQGTAIIAAGLTGSTAASRYVGATTTGAPASGAHLLGDWVVTQDGHIFICTTAGTPGTWTNAGSGGTPATTVTSETTYGIASAVGTSTNYARQDHTHGTPSTPVTSAVAGTGIGISGATGAVTISNTGALLTANTFTGLQTFNAGLTVPAGQPMTTGTRSIQTGTRSTTTNASDTVNLGTFSSTGGAMELRFHTHLIAGTTTITKVYEVVVGATMGTLNTWYLCYPSDASANAAATNDYALEVERTGTGTFVFRFRQKSIASTGVITWTAETLGDTAVTFTPSTTVTAAPAAVTTMHPSNAHVEAAGQVGIGTEAPAALLDVAGAVNSNNTVTATALVSTGLTGGANQTRLAGGTASGAPASGTWAVRDVVVDATGKVWVCTAAGTPGTWVSHSVVSWCRLTKSARQSLTNNTATAVTWETESTDTDGYHEGVTNPSRVTIPTGLDGVFIFNAGVEFDVSTAGARSVALYKNGVVLNHFAYGYSAAQGDIVPSSTIIASAAAGDYFQVFAIQTSGGALNVLSGATGSSYFSCARLGA